MDQIIDVTNRDTIQISAQDIENLLDSFSSGKATVNELKFTNQLSVGDNNKKEENPFSILSESDLNSSYNVSVSLNPKCEVSLNSSGYFSGANVTDVSVESNKSHVLRSLNYANVSPVEANIVSHNGGEIVNWPDLVSQGLSTPTNFVNAENFQFQSLNLTTQLNEATTINPSVTLSPPANSEKTQPGQTSASNMGYYSSNNVQIQSSEAIVTSVNDANSNSAIKKVKKSPTRASPTPSEEMSHKEWIQSCYPELYDMWLKISANEFYQGGVQMLCLNCKTNVGAGFYDGYPVCNSCCPYVTCTVCKIRMTSGFCNGLAICQADQVFIKRTFNNKSRFNKCQKLCPVTVLRWCGYCRLKTCIVSKGFKFIENQSSNVAGPSVKSFNSRKRKQTDLMTMYSINEVPTETTVTEADVSKMQANQAPASSFQETKDVISPFSQPAPLKKRKVSPHIGSEGSQAKKQEKQATKPQVQARQMSTDVVSQQPASISSSTSPTPMTNSSRKVEPFNIPGRGRVLPPSSSDNSTSQQEHVNSTDILKSDNTLNKSYDGSSFGKTTGKSRGITSNNYNLSATSQWVLDQQERYLKYHMDLFKQRSSQQNYHENYLTSFNICI